jgi:predicted TIM-barrel fold metal-dependent hydrolase
MSAWRTGLTAELADPSRRSLLRGITALGASTLLPAVSSWARVTTAVNTPHAIDCHHHFASKAYLKALTAKQGHRVPGYSSQLTWVGQGPTRTGWRDYLPARDSEESGQQGIACSLLSCTTPGVWFGDAQETRRLTRDMNDFGAKAVADSKGRFGLFAVLPLPLIEDSLREIEYALDTLKADGVGILSSYGNHWLGDPAFQPVFDELNRRKAVVFVHATDAPCCQDLFPDLGAAGVEWNFDTARTIFSLLSTGAATRYANIRFIFSHGGGALISLLQRFGIGDADTIADVLARPAETDSRLYHLRRFYYDTANATNPVEMQGLKMAVGTSQILFGTDRLPDEHGSADGPGKSVIGLQKCGLNPQELRDIFRGNAERLFPRLRATA